MMQRSAKSTFLRERETFKSNLVHVVVLVLVSKAHYYFSPVLTQGIRHSLPIQSHNERKTFRNQKLSKDN